MVDSKCKNLIKEGTAKCGELQSYCVGWGIMGDSHPCVVKCEACGGDKCQKYPD